MNHLLLAGGAREGAEEDRVYIDDVFAINLRVGTGTGTRVSTPVKLGEVAAIQRTLGSEKINGMADNGSVIVAVGDAGAIYTSNDRGITWTKRTSGTANNLQDVAWNGTYWVAVGLGGVIRTATSAATSWTTRTSGTTGNLYCVCWTGTYFAAAGIGVVLTSTTGISGWTNRTPSGNLAAHNYYSIVGNSVGLCAMTLGGVMVSKDDGATWSLLEPIPGSYSVNGCSLAGDEFWFFGTRFTYRSVDLLNWENVPQFENGSITDVQSDGTRRFALVRNSVVSRGSFLVDMTDLATRKEILNTGVDHGSFGGVLLVNGQALAHGASGGIVQSLPLVSEAGNGGLVVTKARNLSTSYTWAWHDTLRGATRELVSSSAAAEVVRTDGLTSFTADGFELGASAKLGSNGYNFVDYIFAQAPRFFWMVQWEGDGTNGRKLEHGLRIEPGLIATASIDASSNWAVYHRSAEGDLFLNLNNTPSQSRAIINAADASTFTVSGAANSAGVSYIAYLWAHDPSDDGFIQCGIMAGNETVELGWEPQYVMLKGTTAAGAWSVVDFMRGIPVGGNAACLYPNLGNVEAAAATLEPTSSGFVGKMAGSTSFVYMAIRRPNKPPTDGRQVFQPIARTGTGSATTISTGIRTDVLMSRPRTVAVPFYLWSRQRGAGNYVQTNSAALQTANTSGLTGFDLNDGVRVGTTYPNAANAQILYAFKRAPGFMTEIVFSEVSGLQDIPHDLGVMPELSICKAMAGGATGSWQFAVSDTGLIMNLATPTTGSGIGSYATSRTIKPVAMGVDTSPTRAGSTYSALLFASCPGVSKVGRFVGTDGSQAIDCGFASGARFVLIVREDGGDRIVWDAARGIVADNDPRLALNQTTVEVGTDDSIDPHPAGFIVNQNAVTNMNVAGARYLFLAIA